jgi:hypothetical protein
MTETSMVCRDHRCSHHIQKDMRVIKSRHPIDPLGTVLAPSQNTGAGGGQAIASWRLESKRAALARPLAGQICSE